MKTKRLILIASIMIMLTAWIVITVGQKATVSSNLYLYILAFVVLLGIVLLANVNKKNKELKEGQPAENELSTLIKYKAGYLAYMYSSYMWLFIFKDKFPTIESIIGGGILCSALIFTITKYRVKRTMNAK